MKSIIDKYPIAIFYITTFLLSGLMLLLNIFVFTDAEKYALSFPQLAPGIVALVFIWLRYGRNGLKELFGKFTVSKDNAQWLILSIIVPAVIVSLSYCVLSLINGKNILTPALDGISVYLCYLVGIIIGSIGEEIGWRGFMLPQLQLKYSAFLSSIILGGLWGFWHVDFRFGILGFVLFSIITIELAILFTWVYNKSNGNVLSAVIFHSVLNIMTRILLYSEWGIRVFVVQFFVFGSFCILVIKISGINYFSQNGQYNLLIKNNNVRK